MSDPFTTLIDLDRGRRPGLRLRLDGEEYPMRAPEALPMGDAFQLGEAVERLRCEATPRAGVDAAVEQIAAIIAPGLPVALSRRQERSLVHFYIGHLADAVQRLTTPAGDPVPFCAPARASSRRRGSRRASAPDCGSSSPCR
jgi:hypothetical protein